MGGVGGVGGGGGYGGWLGGVLGLWHDPPVTRLRWLACAAVVTLGGAFGCGSDDEGSGSGTGGAATGGADASGGAPSGGSASGGAASGGEASGGGAGGSGGASGGESGGGGSGGEIDVDELGEPCVDDACPGGLTPTVHCGIAGCEVTQFCTCELPCEDDPDVCPEGSTCSTVSDGPGTICVRS